MHAVAHTGAVGTPVVLAALRHLCYLQVVIVFGNLGLL